MFVTIGLMSILADFYQRHNISRFVKLSHRVKAAKWNEVTGKWIVDVQDLTNTSSPILQDECHVLIDGSGFLNNWRWPDIRDFSKFEKPKVHTANWDLNSDFKGKVVGVIGNGSSAIQVRRIYCGRVINFTDRTPGCPKVGSR